MNKFKPLLVMLFLLPLFCAAQNQHKLWYKQPASTWTEALPLGNGRLGAMIFGRVSQELIQLNEGTLWSGGPVKQNVNPEAYKYLLETREALLKDSDYIKAAVLARQMQGVYSESFEPLGNVMIDQRFESSNTTNYYRDLDIKNAVSTTRFEINGTKYKRQIFISAPDQVIVMRLTANGSDKLNFKVSTRSPLSYRNNYVQNNEIVMKGRAPFHTDPNYISYNKQPVIYCDSLTGKQGMRYILLIKAVGDGAITSDSAGIVVKNASDVTLFMSAATSFNGFNRSPDTEGKDEAKIATRYLDYAVTKGRQLIFKRHLIDYRQYFNRVQFSLKPALDNHNSALPTDERLLAYQHSSDPQLETLYYNFGRYLLICCSRPGGTAANLQGIWNDQVRPPWSSNFTTNINLQMNYWPAEGTNLTEMTSPLIEQIKHLAITGRTTAAEFYNAKGWVVHHNSDLWALSNPVGEGNGDPKWANWAMGSPWLCQHLWNHYQYTGDKTFLKKIAYPLMKGAAEFCLDWLVQNKDGLLVTAPSVSPENDFIDDKGHKGNVSVATTMDMCIIRDLFTNLIEASAVLGKDKGYRAMLMIKKAKLFPLQIGKKGNIQEWYKDWADEDPHHRHVSQLFGLYPGHEISPLTTPEFVAAAKKTLEMRGDEGTGWSLAWKINFWARLRDGDHAYKLIRHLLRAADEKKTGTTTYTGDGSGTYTNLFDAHPPFQIDGNFACVAGMTELLVQSQMGELDLLPALPGAWPNGTIKGLKAIGNFEVAIKWKNKQLKSSVIKSFKGTTCKLRTQIPVKILGLNVKSQKNTIGYLTVFKTQAGRQYRVIVN